MVRSLTPLSKCHKLSFTMAAAFRTTSLEDMDGIE
jgi:hypothetical protein